jgi:murein L,D-transpeptidase YafK
MWAAVGACAIALAMAAGPGSDAVQADGDDRFAGHPAAEARLREAAKKARVPFPLEDVVLICRKKDRVLELRSRGKLVRSYRVALGFTPAGHKEREGDGRTPEGDYWICTRNGKSRFHLFLGIAYPGERDARAGRKRGEIDDETYARVAKVKRPQQPPWKTPLGGEVGIHGRGGAERGDWTAGCIAIEDAEVDELWLACPLGTPIRIMP